MKRQNEIAKELGVSKAYISMVLNGKKAQSQRVSKELASFTVAHGEGG